MQNSTQRSFHPFLAPLLLIILFAAVSLVSIQQIQQQRMAVKEVAWMTAYLGGYPQTNLSENQIDIIKNSAVIVSGEAEDAGVKATLKSVCGNGYTTYFLLDVELPKEMKGWSFENIELNMNDDTIQNQLSHGTSLTPLPDDNIEDNHYSFLMSTDVAYDKDYDYRFNNGIIRMLHLRNISIYPKDSEPMRAIEGQWDFEILYQDEGKVLQLIHEPVIVSGAKNHPKQYFEAKILSLTISEFSLECDYELTPNTKQTSPDSIRPSIMMKDGRTVQANPHSGTSSDTNGTFSWNFPVPISLDEAASVKLNNVILPIQQKVA